MAAGIASATLTAINAFAAKLRIDPVRDAAGKLYLEGAPRATGCRLR